MRPMPALIAAALMAAASPVPAQDAAAAAVSIGTEDVPVPPNPDLALPGVPDVTRPVIPEVAQPDVAPIRGTAEVWADDPLRVFGATEVDLADLLWIARPVVVFASSPRDPAYIEQMQYLAEDPDRLLERDVMIVSDTDPEVRSALRDRLRPRGFMMVLIGKDGQVKLRKPLPWTVREISRSIDKMPLRHREVSGN